MVITPVFETGIQGSIPCKNNFKPVYPSPVKGGALKMHCVMLRGFKSHCWYIFYLNTTDMRLLPGLIACTYFRCIPTIRPTD